MIEMYDSVGEGDGEDDHHRQGVREMVFKEWCHEHEDMTRI